MVWVSNAKIKIQLKILMLDIYLMTHSYPSSLLQFLFLFLLLGVLHNILQIIFHRIKDQENL